MNTNIHDILIYIHFTSILHPFYIHFTSIVSLFFSFLVTVLVESGRCRLAAERRVLLVEAHAIQRLSRLHGLLGRLERGDEAALATAAGSMGCWDDSMMDLRCTDRRKGHHN